MGDDPGKLTAEGMLLAHLQSIEKGVAAVQAEVRETREGLHHRMHDLDKRVSRLEDDEERREQRARSAWQRHGVAISAVSALVATLSLAVSVALGVT